MTYSNFILNKIKGFEGFSPSPQYDYGNNSQGYGTSVDFNKSVLGLDWSKDITKNQAYLCLKAKLSEISFDLIYYIGIDHRMSQNQFDALVSFVFNLGFKGSELIIERINKGFNDDQLRQSWLKYTKANGNDLKGLELRRIEEMRIYSMNTFEFLLEYHGTKLLLLIPLFYAFR